MGKSKGKRGIQYGARERAADRGRAAEYERIAENENKADIIIIGAGASGLAAAIFASEDGEGDCSTENPGSGGENNGISRESGCEGRRKLSVIVVDGNDIAGKKLYATGNGRCNFTNENCQASEYNEPGDGFVSSVLQKFTVRDTIAFFEEKGMIARIENNGRYYPYSGQASCVVGVLERAADRNGCRFIFSDRVTNVGKCDGSEGSRYPYFAELESGRRLICNKLIIACGGRAGLKTGSTGDGYGFARAFGHSLRAPRPALVPVESDDAFLTELAGVRVKGRVTLWACDASDGSGAKARKKLAEESGEIQFTKTGISGICVFDLTRRMDDLRPPKPIKKSAAHDREDVKKSQASYVISCDFAPEYSREQLTEFTEKRTADGIRLEEALSGIVNARLAKVIAGMCMSDCDTRQPHEDVAGENAPGGRDGGSSPMAAAKSAAPGEMEAAAKSAAPGEMEAAAKSAALIKGFEVSAARTRGWNDAQVTCGGVCRDEIDENTMESRLTPGLYFCGEVADVDGRCGGFNLQWAWSSGAVAGTGARKSVRNTLCSE